jgi:hypothetical protein
MPSDWSLPRISTDYTYRGIDAALLESEHLRLFVLPGKGGDILEFRDKRTDTDVLWHARHNWQPPADRYVPSEAPTTWLDHYPGGWQVNLPVGGFGWEIEGNAYGLHGESALLPWEATVTQDDVSGVALGLVVELVRYPFRYERELRLPADEPALHIEESVTNLGGVELGYIWQQHVALGPPLLGPAARLDLPAATGVVEPESSTFENGRLAYGETFEWPMAPTRDGGIADLREIPPPDAGLHDQCYATDLDAGWYALTNPDLGLGFGLTFPPDPFESVWYWQPFGGFHESPYFSRNYNVGLEPSTAYPGGDIPDAQRANGTMKTLAPNETVSASMTAVTYHDVEAVQAIAPDGTVSGR